MNQKITRQRKSSFLPNKPARHLRALSQKSLKKLATQRLEFNVPTTIQGHVRTIKFCHRQNIHFKSLSYVDPFSKLNQGKIINEHGKAPICVQALTHKHTHTHTRTHPPSQRHARARAHARTHARTHTHTHTHTHTVYRYHFKNNNLKMGEGLRQNLHW